MTVNYIAATQRCAAYTIIIASPIFLENKAAHFRTEQDKAREENLREFTKA